MDFARLKTPPQHGDILVEPPAAELAQLAKANHAQMGQHNFAILDQSAVDVRRATRRHLGLAGDTLVILTGHQPEFIHAGVWAKHVVAQRLAKAVSGRAINLVVDHDAPGDCVLHIPAVRDGRVAVTPLRYVDLPRGWAVELAEGLSATRLSSCEQAVRTELGKRFDRSMMPVYLKRLTDSTTGATWVEQTVAGRRAVEHSLGVRIDDVRVSEVWGGPLLAEMVVRAAEFAACYNRSLAAYRHRHRVRSRQHPIPDLLVTADRIEVPAWVYRDSEPRRRMFIAVHADSVAVYADDERVGVLDRSLLSRVDTTAGAMAALEGVRVRPRALALTLWARLLVGDLFVHGIGGAKYDRITDDLIRGFYGVEPPAMACVSATMRLDLPRHPIRPAELATARRRRRDVIHNPQRYVPHDEETARLLEKRAAAIARSGSLRGSGKAAERRQTFESIREANRRVLELHDGHVARIGREVLELERLAADDQIAGRRDFFFALFSRSDLEMLLSRLPEVAVMCV